MSANKNTSSKKSKRAPQPWVIPSFGSALPSSGVASKPRKPHQNLMSAPSFSISPNTRPGRAPPPPPQPTRARDDKGASETPIKRLKTDTGDSKRDRRGRDVGGRSSDDEGPSASMADSPSSASTSTLPLGASAKRLRPLTTPSKHLPPPPAYNLSRPPPRPSAFTKPFAPLSAILPVAIKAEPRPADPSPKPDRPLVGLIGIASHVDVKDEVTGSPRVKEEGGEGMNARELLSGKSPTKGKKAYQGVLPLSSNASLLLASHANTLKHFYGNKTAPHTPHHHHSPRPPPDLHLRVLSIAQASALKPRLSRTTCRILPPPDPGSPTKSGHPEDETLEEEEAVGTVLLMLPEGGFGGGPRREVAVGRTILGWRPWLEVEVGEGGERALMLDKFEVE